MLFSKAIVRLPCLNLSSGLGSAEHGKPDHGLALHQHGKYVEALAECGLDVRVMAADENYPDSTFVEDAALLIPEVAVITYPGAPSRQGEIIDMQEILQGYYEKIEMIKPPGTLEAGDVMMAGKHFYIGLSERTNPEGAGQLMDILNHYGMTGSIVRVPKMLHLKSGISYLENNNMLATKILANQADFKDYNIIMVPPEESYAANSVWINDTVLVPEGYPVTQENIHKNGYKTITLKMSEFRKLDGGLSCLSLRF